jgi:hypothetical protein
MGRLRTLQRRMAVGLLMTDDLTCPSCSGTIAGVVIPGAYDGTLFWSCMECGHPFHRFPQGHHLRERAQSFIDEIEKHNREAGS